MENFDFIYYINIQQDERLLKIVAMATIEKQAEIPDDAYKMPVDWKLIKDEMEAFFPPLCKLARPWKAYEQHYTEALQPNVRKGSFDRNVSASDRTNMRHFRVNTALLLLFSNAGRRSHS